MPSLVNPDATQSAETTQCPSTQRSAPKTEDSEVDPAEIKENGEHCSLSDSPTDISEKRECSPPPNGSENSTDDERKNSSSAAGDEAESNDHQTTAETEDEAKAAAEAAALRKEEIAKLQKQLADTDEKIEAVDAELRGVLWDYIPKFKCKNIYNARRAEVIENQQ